MKQSGIIYPDDADLEFKARNSPFENSFTQQPVLFGIKEPEVKTIDVGEVDESNESNESLDEALGDEDVQVREKEKNFLSSRSVSDNNNFLDHVRSLNLGKSAISKPKYKYSDSRRKGKKQAKKKHKSGSVRIKPKIKLPRLRSPKIRKPRLHKRSKKHGEYYVTTTNVDSDSLKDSYQKNSLDDFDFGDFSSDNNSGSFRKNNSAKDYAYDTDNIDAVNKDDTGLENLAQNDDSKLHKESSENKTSKSKKSEGSEAAGQLMTSGDIMVRIIIAAILGVFGFFYIFTQLGIFG